MSPFYGSPVVDKRQLVKLCEIVGQGDSGKSAIGEKRTLGLRHPDRLELTHFGHFLVGLGEIKRSYSWR